MKNRMTFRTVAHPAVGSAAGETQRSSDEER